MENSKYRSSLPCPYQFNSHYQVIELIGSGGNSLCYRVVGTAEQNKGKYYIMKEYFPSLFAEMFTREKDVLVFKERTTKNNIIKQLLQNTIEKELEIGRLLALTASNNNPYFFYGHITKPSNYSDSYYMILDTEEGICLKDLLYKKYDILTALDFIFKIIEAIKEIHQHNILHLDIKPENLYLSKTGVIKPIDFGSATTKGEKNIQDILFSSSYNYTIGYSSPSLNQINTLRRRLSYQRLSDDNFKDQELLVKEVTALNESADIYSIMQVFLKMICSKNIYQLRELASARLDTKEILLNELNKIVPNYIITPLSSIILRAINEEYYDLSKLENDLLQIKEILSNQGIHPSLFIKFSGDEYNRSIKYRNIYIDDQLLPKVKLNISQTTYKNLIEFVKESHSLSDFRRHCFVIGEGASGKTYSLLKSWAYYLEMYKNNETIIPLYIPCYSLENNEYPILTYLYHHYLGHLPSSSNYIHDLLVFFKEDRHTYYLFIDAYNNFSYDFKVFKKEIDKLMKIPSIRLIITSRHSCPFKQMSIVTIQALEEKFIRNRISKISQHFSNNRQLYDILSNPLMLLLFTQSYQDLEYQHVFAELDYSKLTTASLMKKCLEVQIYGDQPINHYYVKVVFPLIVAYLNKQGCQNMIISQKELYQAIYHVYDYLVITKRKYLISEGLSDAFCDDTPIDNFNRIIVEDMHLLREIDQGCYIWLHENYKDLFVGWGMALITENDNSYFQEYLDYVNTNDFKYSSDLNYLSTQITKYQYYIELYGFNYSGEGFEKFRLLLRTLAYVFSDITDDYHSYIYTHEALKYYQDVPVSDEDRLYYAESLNALGYGLNTLKQEKIKDTGYLQLAYDTYQHAKKIVELLPYGNQRMVIEAKLYSNTGAYYLAKWVQDNRDDYLEQSFENHNKALQIRIRLLNMNLNLPLEDAIKELLLLEKISGYGAALATSLTTIGTDYYYFKDYQQSVFYHNLALLIREKLEDWHANENRLRIIGSLIKQKKINSQELMMIYEYLVLIIDNIKINYRYHEMDNIASTFKDLIPFIDREHYQLYIDLVNQFDQFYNNIMALIGESINLYQDMQEIQFL